MTRKIAAATRAEYIQIWGIRIEFTGNYARVAP